MQQLNRVNSNYVLGAAALAGAYWYFYMRTPTPIVVATPLPAPVKKNEGSAFPATEQEEKPAGESTGDGSITNAAAPNAEKYYGVGGVEFMTQGVNKKHMKSGPFFGPMKY
jgi:hypothetical protein